MRIKNFIKNYPCTIFFAILLLVSISTIFVEGKVYALSSSNSKAKKCECLPRGCPQELPPETRLCSMKGNRCYCTIGMDNSWTYCDSPEVQVCTLTNGCSSCDECSPADCKDDCDIKGCNCFTRVVDSYKPCTKPPVDCGDCRLIDP